MIVEIKPRSEKECRHVFLAAYRPPTVGDPNWYVEIPGVEGCFSSGKTRDEAGENIIEALTNHSLKKPLSIREVMQMDSMKYMYKSGYQGFEFIIGTAIVQVQPIEDQ